MASVPSGLALAGPLNNHGELRVPPFSPSYPLPCHFAWLLAPWHFPRCPSGSLQTSYRSSAGETWTLRPKVPPRSGTSIQCHRGSLGTSMRETWGGDWGKLKTEPLCSVSLQTLWDSQARKCSPGFSGLGFSYVFSGKGGAFSLLDGSPEPLTRFH